jgi:acyl-CoA synthetase (AMP-forming)/AMP-acid ligase II
LLALVEELGATHVTGAESVLRALQDYLGADKPLTGLLKPQNSNQMAWFRERVGFDAAQIGSAFGMTETIGPHSGFRGLEDTHGALKGSVGHALPGVIRRIVDPGTHCPLPSGEEGELQVKGRWLMDGYYKLSPGSCFDAEGYFSTGDRCRIDADGLLHFLGRDSGMIKTSGANVAPEEVEVALRRCDDVVEAVVVGLPDTKRGQVVAAAVALRPAASADEQILRDALRGKLSSFKIPRFIRFMPFDDMPRTASNKIDRRAVARHLSEAFN